MIAVGSTSPKMAALKAVGIICAYFLGAFYSCGSSISAQDARTSLIQEAAEQNTQGVITNTNNQLLQEELMWTYTEEDRRADQIGDYARDRTASEIIVHFGRPQTIQRPSDGCLVDKSVSPAELLTSDGVTWIYMSGSSTCEMLTMRNNRCTAAERVECFY